MEAILLVPELANFDPDRMILQCYDPGHKVVKLAYLCDGGPNEDRAFVVEFAGLGLLHLPTILHEAIFPVSLSHTEAISLIPSISYDDSEFRPGTGRFQLVGFIDREGARTGFYVAAESTSWVIVPIEACAFAL